MLAKVESVRQMQELIARYRQANQTIGFVPTMGALHKGHLSLVRASLEECHTTVVSIFVNPTQFGPNEDYQRYPRTPHEDERKLQDLGVDILFSPTVEQMYPSGYDTYIIQEKLPNRLCGAFRPGHFRGVLTVVLKLLNIVQPHKAYFGHKDFQQSVVIRQMVRDLHLPVEIRVMPTVREPDGLAMSSRNQYLSSEERQRALCLYKGLVQAKEMVRRGIVCAKEVKKTVQKLIESTEGVRLEYVEIVEPNHLEPVETIKRGHVMALAAWVGKARLIDNMVLWE